MAREGAKGTAMSRLSQQLCEYGRRFKHRARVYRLVARHPGTPRLSRWLMTLALAYVLMPFDLIPDWIPVLGLLDDLIIVPLLAWLALRAVPPQVYEECVRQAANGAHH